MNNGSSDTPQVGDKYREIAPLAVSRERALAMSQCHLWGRNDPVFITLKHRVTQLCNLARRGSL